MLATMRQDGNDGEVMDWGDSHVATAGPISLILQASFVIISAKIKAFGSSSMKIGDSAEPLLAMDFDITINGIATA